MTNIIEIKTDEYVIQMIGFKEKPDPIEESVEVIVKFNDNTDYSATFCTLDYLHALMQENASYNVFNDGRYLWGWGTNTIIIAGWAQHLIEDAVADMVLTDTISHVFARV